jgi:pimeloyl-ACP methyl ester carboxylesterase
MLFITDDGVRLQYLDEGQGLPVLLLHGFPLNADSFRPQIAALSNRYRFIVPDHRGFGRSGPGAGPTEMARIARDALGILDLLEIHRAVIGGVSMGGYAAMALLRQDAGRAESLVLIDTQAGADDDAAKQRREDTARAVLEKGIELLVDSMLPKLVAPAADQQVKTEVAAMIRATSAEGAAAALRGMALRTDSRDMLGRFAGPALVIVGEEDTLTPPARSREMKSLLQAGELCVIPGAGHLPNMEKPEVFNKALDSFLARSR